MNNFMENIFSRAQKLHRTIIIPESNDPRIKEAATTLHHRQICNVILLEEHEKYHDISFKNTLAHQLYLLRQHKNLTEEEAKKLINDPFYFGVMMVKLGYADGMVGGANSPTPRLLRPTLQILKSPTGKLVSGFFIITAPQETFIFADCAINPEPTPSLLTQIASDSVKSYQKLIGSSPRVAFLSYSTAGSSQGPLVDKIKTAATQFKQLYPDIISDGEIQVDAAISPEVAARKCPQSRLQGRANILIFPDLNSGNIGYKLAHIFGNNIAIGPLIQGLEKPVNDLSRSCTTEEIALNAAITAIQSSE
ncbi:MAG TPA: phosphate acyltransferase [Candidatus Woesebacteria bacterium]|nr:phosphate acyltransferase [Candidatus Woesebacteria bacterium]